MKVALVTGGNQGLGLSTAKELTALGYHVYITVRSDEKGLGAVGNIKAENASALVDYEVMDMGDLISVADFIDRFSPEALDLLVCNAGIMNTPFAISKDSFEMQYQVNHLAHLLLTIKFLPKLKKAGRSRVVFLSSRAHMRHSEPIDYDALSKESAETYNGWHAYGRSKLSNILAAKALAKRFPISTSGINFFAVHPGLVDTGLLTKGGLNLKGMKVTDGIKCTIYVATSSDLENSSGEYWHNEVTEFIRGSLETPKFMTKIANSEEEADKMWEHSLKMLGIRNEEVI